jgi:hypothetical protein
MYAVERSQANRCAAGDSSANQHCADGDRWAHPVLRTREGDETRHRPQSDSLVENWFFFERVNDRNTIVPAWQTTMEPGSDP